MWDWRQVNGHLKDRACRSVLRELESRGLIDLPPGLRRGSRSSSTFAAELSLNKSLVEGSVEDFLPFRFESRFLGSCYRAANWVCVGYTKGMGKKGGCFVYHGQSKKVYLYVIDKFMRDKIGSSEEGDPPLTREFLLSMKPQLALSKEKKKMIIRHEGWRPDLPPRLDLSRDDVDNLADELASFHALFEDGFKRIEQHDLGRCYLQGLLSDVDRKSMEPMALRLSGPKAVRNLQRFMSEYRWDEEFIGDRHRRELAALIGDRDGAFSVDSSEFPKKGTESVGVGRQYCGRLGKIENCQSGVFVGYASSKGFGLVDRRLFMPEHWFSAKNEKRREKCKVPADLTFKTKPQLAVEMIRQLHSTGLFPGRWVTCDTIFGNSPDFVDGLPDDLYYLAEVVKTTKVWGESGSVNIDSSNETRPISQVANDPDLHWHEVKLLEGAKGPIMARIARLRVITAKDGQEKWLFMRHCPESGKIKYFLSNASVETTLKEMIHVCTLRWPVEQCFQEGKGELGMDHYEHRSWAAWHRHMTYVFLAQLFLLKLRFTLKKTLQT
jgi:SRSO17 transposase